jgi:hypothetical protein
MLARRAATVDVVVALRPRGGVAAVVSGGVELLWVDARDRERHGLIRNSRACGVSREDREGLGLTRRQRSRRDWRQREDACRRRRPPRFSGVSAHRENRLVLAIAPHRLAFEMQALS